MIKKEKESYKKTFNIQLIDLRNIIEKTLNGQGYEFSKTETDSNWKITKNQYNVNNGYLFLDICHAIGYNVIIKPVNQGNSAEIKKLIREIDNNTNLLAL